jgi:RNA polymerase sigma-70 factor (ECF subfamily)
MPTAVPLPCMSFSTRSDPRVNLRLVEKSPGAPAVDQRPSLPDEALVNRIRSGDTQVAAVLCDRLWPQVDRTIRRLLGRNDSDCDDIRQIAMIELVNTISRYRGECSLDRWAQSVTAHIIFKHIRRRNLERRLFSELLLDSPHASPIQLERASASRELLALVARHMDDLPEARAWAFVLHDVLGYDLSEVAEMTETSVAAAQSRLSRGRRELHAAIAKDSKLAELLASEGVGVMS